MDRTLRRLLGALEGMDASTASDPLAVYEALGQELPRLAALNQEDLDEKLADIERDIDSLGREAARATQEYEHARRLGRVLEELVRI